MFLSTLHPIGPLSIAYLYGIPARKTFLHFRRTEVIAFVARKVISVGVVFALGYIKAASKIGPRHSQRRMGQTRLNGGIKCAESSSPHTHPSPVRLIPLPRAQEVQQK
jgi:hypothetical protein